MPLAFSGGQMLEEWTSKLYHMGFFGAGIWALSFLSCYSEQSVELS